MMHKHEKSDSAIVAVKPTNKAEHSAAESAARIKLQDDEGGVGGVITPLGHLRRGVLSLPPHRLSRGVEPHRLATVARPPL